MPRLFARSPLSLILLPLFAALLLALLLRATVAAAPAPAAPVAPQAASITLTKTVGTGPSCAATRTITVNAGTLVTFCYTVHNSGSESHLHHWLDDSELGIIFANVAYTLDPGETTFVTQTQVITQSLTNIGFWQADMATANYVSASSSATVTISAPPVNPSLLLTKTVGTSPTGCASGKSVTILQGTPVYFCYRVKNTGDVALNVHRLVDNRLGTLFDNVANPLAPGATRTYTRTAYPGVSATNVATWTGWLTGTAGTFVRDSDSASVTVTPRNLAVLFTKTVGITNACASTDLITVVPGTRVVYCYKLRNTGNVPLTVHKLVDNRLGTILNNVTVALSPNQSYAITRAVTANITTTNVATWTAAMTSATGLRVTATDSATVRTPRTLRLDFRKTVGTDPNNCSTSETITVIAGTQVVYCYTAKNTGNVPLTVHTLSDGDLGPIFTNKPYTLAVNASLVVTAVDTPLITTTAAATWTAAMTSPTGLRVTRSDGARVNVVANPTAITLTKTVGVEGGPCATTRAILVPPGTNVYYCYTVKNTGPITLPKHQLYDDDIEFDILPPDFSYPLQPDEVLSTTDLPVVVSRAITKTTVNFALWQSYINDILYAQATASATVRVATAESQARLTVGASGATPAACPSGQLFEGEAGASHRYCLRVENTGGVTLTQHLVQMPALGVDTTLAAPLAPGAAMTVTAAELPALGAQPLSLSQVVTASVTSSFNPDGAPFSTRAVSAVTLYLAGEAHYTWLPAVQQGTQP